jgi:nitrogen fixation protein FixH
VTGNVPNKSGRLWPWFVASLLVATAAAQGIMLYAATHDPTFAVVPDYYNKAVAWDSTLAVEEASAALGWRAALDLEAAGPATAVRVVVTDSAGVPVAGAAVHAELVSNLDAAHPVALALADEGDGRYATTTSALRPGIWDVRLDVRARGSRFTPVVRTEYRP